MRMSYLRTGTTPKEIEHTRDMSSDCSRYLKRPSARNNVCVKGLVFKIFTLRGKSELKLHQCNYLYFINNNFFFLLTNLRFYVFFIFKTANLLEAPAPFLFLVQEI